MASEPGLSPDAYAHGPRRRWVVLVFMVVVVVALSVYRGWLVKETPAPRTLTLYGFSALENVMNDGIFPAFQEAWKVRTGERLEFIATFAGSGAITDLIIDAFPAEVAILASEIDARRLVRRGVVPDGSWRRLPRGGVMSRSPVVIAVPAGNPAHVRDFGDLASGEHEVVHPDPTSSGAGEWGVLAVYGGALRESGDPDRAADRLAALWRRVKFRPPSARRARVVFEAGTGDALVTYESEVRKMKDRPSVRPVEPVYPSRTILSEHLVVKIHRNVTSSSRELVDAFVEFLWSKRAQRLLVAHGFRSVDPEEEPRGSGGSTPGTSSRFFTLQDLGGAARASDTILRNPALSGLRPSAQD